MLRFVSILSTFYCLQCTKNTVLKQYGFDSLSIAYFDKGKNGLPFLIIKFDISNYFELVLVTATNPFFFVFGLVYFYYFATFFSYLKKYIFTLFLLHVNPLNFKF